MTARLPPHDTDAEAAVLASCLLDRAALDDVAALLPDAAAFFSEPHRRIWEATRAVDAGGGAVDLVSVAHELRATGRLDSVGGMAALAELCDSTPAVANVLDHARIVLDRWSMRRVIDAARVVQAEALAGDVGDVTTWLQGVEARVYEATRRDERQTSLATLRQAVQDESAAMAERKAQRSALGIRTGLRDLDAKIGGWMRGLKYTLAARPGMGKTGLALTCALNVAKAGEAVVFVSLEMPRDQLVQRAIAQESGVSTDLIAEAHRMSGDDWTSVARAFKRLGDLPLAIDDAAGQTVASIRSAVRRGMSKLAKEGHSARLGLVVIDYLQLMTPSGKAGRNRENDVAEMSNGTRQLAKEFDCAVLELSQLSRECEKRGDKRPQLSDLRESGAIEQDAFGVLAIYRDGYYAQPKVDSGECEILVLKLRQWGSTGTVRAFFNGPTTAFHDLAQEPDGFENDFNDGRY